MDGFIIAGILFGAMIWLGTAGFCGWMAGDKGRNALGWAGLGLLFGFLALFTVALLPTCPAAPRERSTDSPGTLRTIALGLGVAAVVLLVTGLVLGAA